MTALIDTPDYRAFCAGRLADPYPLLARLRREEPVHWSPVANSWIVTRYDDVTAVLQHDPHFTANRLDRLLDQLPPSTASNFLVLGDHLRTWIQYYDPPEHARLRATANRPFTPRPIAAMSDSVDTLIGGLLDQFGRNPSPDLVKDFAYPLPAIVIARVLGVPPSDRDRIKDWADRFTRFMEGVGDDPAGDAEAAEDAVVELSAYLASEIEAHGTSRSEDLIGTLIGELHAGRLSEQELYGWCMFLLQAGHETTTGLIGNGIVTLLQHREQLEELRDHPELTESAVEELLRFDSPVQRISRITLHDVELGGKPIPAGARVWAMLGAANRDPERFDDPDALDLKRRPNRHVAFGYGIHFCLGAPLARLEGRLAIRQIIDRFPELDVAGEPVRWEGVSLNRFTSLPVRLRTKKAGAAVATR
jgi:cytochrome P450